MAYNIDWKSAPPTAKTTIHMKPDENGKLVTLSYTHISPFGMSIHSSTDPKSQYPPESFKLIPRKERGITEVILEPSDEQLRKQMERITPISEDIPTSERSRSSVISQKNSSSHFEEYSPPVSSPSYDSSLKSQSTQGSFQSSGKSTTTTHKTSQPYTVKLNPNPYYTPTLQGRHLESTPVSPVTPTYGVAPQPQPKTLAQMAAKKPHSTFF